MIGWTVIPAALLLDAALGDPPRLPHPTRAVGAIASKIEAPLRRAFPPLVAGFLGWMIVVGSAAAFALALPPLLGLAAAAFGASPSMVDACEWAARIWLVYVSIAPHDLASHALRVAKALSAPGTSPEAALERARRAVAMIVGRDTDRLDEAGVIRAAVESVAESTADGVCAPLFWALVLGPAGAFAYRAANTLDSMWGHKDERYILYGKTAARLDDALNWIPARLAFFASVVAAFVLGLVSRRRYSAGAALRIGWRDRRKHESPNAAWLEASFAGALGLRLGGDAWYGGERLEKSFLGEARREPEAADPGKSVVLMYATTVVFALAGVCIAILAGR
ncbi:MAG: adenosylcobinamide-phosphate synthase CbiB [Rectinemataceae bacterium]